MTEWQSMELAKLREKEEALVMEIMPAAELAKQMPRSAAFCRHWAELCEARSNALKQISSLALMEFESNGRMD